LVGEYGIFIAFYAPIKDIVISGETRKYGSLYKPAYAVIVLGIHFVNTVLMSAKPAQVFSEPDL
jgi:hypothetical protein